MGAIIWLASYPKSGNTWTRSFLHNMLHNAQEPVDINMLGQFCLGGSSRRWFEAISPAPLEELSPEALAKLRPAAQVRMTATSRDSVFVKTHNYLGPWFGVPLHNMAVTAGGIYVLRNPLDVVLSLRHHFGFSADDAIEFMARQGAGTKLTPKLVPEVYDSWSAHVASWTTEKNPRLFVVRYEDLRDDPIRYFGDMTRFLGLQPTEERLERAVKNSSFDVLKAQESERGFKEKPAHASAFFREGRAGQWEDELTEAQIRRVITDHRVQMQRFGYIPAAYSDVTVSAS